MKTEVPLYFFILGLTPLLGVSHSLIHSVLLSGVLFVLLMIQGPLLSLTGYRLSDQARLPALFSLNLLLVTLLDLSFSLVLPVLYPGFGIYLKLMAFNPLILKILADQARGWDLKDSLAYGVRTALGFLAAGSLLAVLREILGAGRLTYGLGGETLVLPWLKDHSFRFLFAGGAGVMILAGFLKAFQNWGYRQGWLWLRQEEPKAGKTAPREDTLPGEGIKSVSPPLTAKKKDPPAAPLPVPSAAPEVPSEVKKPVEETPFQLPEVAETPQEPVPAEPSTESSPEPSPPEWGEDPLKVLEQLGSGRDFEKRRILFLGCGSGEEVYKAAMVLADAKRSNPRFSFRIRGVDSFSARIDLAKEGVYRDVQMEDVTLEKKQRYLLQNREEGKRLLRIGPDLRQYTEFLVSDYLGPGYFFQKPCDLVMVQQDMDFLNLEERKIFLGQIQAHLNPHGVLILPESWPRETVPGQFRRTGARVYRNE